ncbi:MAG TPA: integrase core domain-containing protein [Thermomicrobiales bacterium]|nr:integrase core domain-containing protein [Thermomicrobiales bacterium]
MLNRLVRQCAQRGQSLARALRRRLIAATKPAEQAVVAGVLADLVRRRPALVAENAFLRQPLLILRRGVKRPRCTPADRALLALLASRVRAWRQALLIVQPETVLRWHREGFRLFWCRKSRPRSAPKPKVAAEPIALIRELAAANRLWGAERIRGELLKLGIRVAKTTVQRHMPGARPPRRDGQTWATFLRNHAAEPWACDFLPVTDLLFRPLHAFIVVALGSRRVVHVGVTRHPTDARVAQQLREATPFGEAPRFLIRDNDCKYGPAFARVAAATGIRERRTACRAPRQNATCERFLGSVRRECLDHVLVLGEDHPRRMLREYAAYCNGDRPQQGLRQRVPDAPTGETPRSGQGGRVQAVPILGGLHHAYQRAA